MKSKLNFLVPVGLVVIALVCVIMVRQGDPSPDGLPGAQQSIPAEETPDKTPVDEVVYTLSPIPSSVPVFTAKPDKGPDSSPAGETTAVEEDGTIVITPDFEAQAGQAVKIVKPGNQVEANMGGGGGDLELGSDGAFHGTPPTPAPVSSTPAPAVPSVAPTAAPVTATPAPVVSSTPETFPTPDPSQGAQEPQGGPPGYNGTYDGQISPDGQYAWIGGFGWIKRGGSDGGTGGDASIFDEHPGEGLSGHKVGNM